MGKVLCGFAMSLDGFIADPQDGVWELFKWLLNGDTELLLPGADRAFKTSPQSAAHYQNIYTTTGALVTGRGDFNASDAWGGKAPMLVPAFIVTHNIPQEWAHAFTFVTDGVESAICQARAAAGEKNVLVSGSKIAQQAITAGLLDEIHIDLSPVLLGEGKRLFENLGANVRNLEIISLIDAPGVTHLKYRVVK